MRDVMAQRRLLREETAELEECHQQVRLTFFFKSLRVITCLFFLTLYVHVAHLCEETVELEECHHQGRLASCHYVSPTGKACVVSLRFLVFFLSFDVTSHNQLMLFMFTGGNACHAVRGRREV
jgi:hypothetical protein